MKFIAALALLFVAVSAQPVAPNGNVIVKRTCGTLSGEELKICQDASIDICISSKWSDLKSVNSLEGIR
jgi:hypothetical protein